MNYQILRAQPADASRLKALAVAAKAHWGYAPEWMAQWAQLFQITGEYIAAHEVYKLVHVDAIVGWYAIVLCEKTARLDDLWVDPAFIGKGLGRVLFEQARQQAVYQGAQRIEFEAEPYAVGFYKHMGATIVGEIASAMGRPLPIMEIKL